MNANRRRTVFFDCFCSLAHLLRSMSNDSVEDCELRSLTPSSISNIKCADRPPLSSLLVPLEPRRRRRIRRASRFESLTAIPSSARDRNVCFRRSNGPDFESSFSSSSCCCKIDRSFSLGPPGEVSPADNVSSSDAKSIWEFDSG
jgi:hypothetical protein